MKPVELWTATGGARMPGRSVAMARRFEDEGWDGVAIADSQNISGDPFVAIALASQAVGKLKFATGVTNSITRHPALMASTAASVQAETGGRFVLGIGRDSALAHIGLAPASVRQFEGCLRRLHSYLAGDEVPFDLAADALLDQQPISSLGMADGPASSRLLWLERALNHVPVDVAASGPRVIKLAARHGDAVTFAVGADPDRVRWAIGVLHDELQCVGRPLDSVSIGVGIPVLVHDEPDVALDLIRGIVGSYARFSVMHGFATGPLTDRATQNLQSVHRSYDMHSHFTAGSPQSKALRAEVIDTFVITGPAGLCVERLQAIVELGVDRLSLKWGRGPRTDPEVLEKDRRRIVDEILPRLR